MGDIIDFQEYVKGVDDGEQFVEQIREALEVIDDADSASWLADTIRQMNNAPPLTFSHSYTVATPVDEDELKRIGDGWREAVQKQVEEVKISMVKTFFACYYEKKKKEFLDRLN